MKKTLTAIALILGLAAASQAAHAETADTGVVWFQRCQATATTIEQTMCEGYLLGVWDSSVALANLVHVPVFCAAGPDPVVGGQLQMIFLNYVNRVPQAMNLAPSDIAFNAFAAASPCPHPRTAAVQ